MGTDLTLTPARSGSCLPHLTSGRSDPLVEDPGDFSRVLHRQSRLQLLLRPKVTSPFLPVASSSPNLSNFAPKGVTWSLLSRLICPSQLL